MAMVQHEFFLTNFWSFDILHVPPKNHVFFVPFNPTPPSNSNRPGAFQFHLAGGTGGRRHGTACTRGGRRRGAARGRCRRGAQRGPPRGRGDGLDAADADVLAAADAGVALGDSGAVAETRRRWMGGWDGDGEL